MKTICKTSTSVLELPLFVCNNERGISGLFSFPRKTDGGGNKMSLVRKNHTFFLVESLLEICVFFGTYHPLPLIIL